MSIRNPEFHKCRLGEIRVGTVLQYWHDSGAMGASLCYARVVKLGEWKMRVRGETGAESWKYWYFFDAIVPEKIVEELRAEGVSI